MGLLLLAIKTCRFYVVLNDVGCWAQWPSDRYSSLGWLTSWLKTSQFPAHEAHICYFEQEHTWCWYGQDPLNFHWIISLQNFLINKRVLQRNCSRFVWWSSDWPEMDRLIVGCDQTFSFFHYRWLLFPWGIQVKSWTTLLWSIPEMRDHGANTEVKTRDARSQC